jgi:DNA repair exonuclease SbcCD nuclease subunit
VRVALISDAHLFQTFIDTYDSVKDFERALDEIGTANPDLLFLGGDIFDYMKTETVYLRHYEGEHHMIKIREIIERFEKPVYAIKGNHDKEEILSGLEQTVSNFRHIKNGIKKFSDFTACFIDSFYETGGYSPNITENMQIALDRILSKVDKLSDRPILLCHETFAPYENSVPSSIIAFIKKSFSFVLNGHMHLWARGNYNSSKIVCLPSLLPSRVVKGKYYSERYKWLSRNSNFERSQLSSPFGYVTFDTDKEDPYFHPFNPSKRILDVFLEVTGLSLEETRKRLKMILSEIDSREEKFELIVLPEISGELEFSPLYLESVKDEFPELCVESIRHQRTVLKTSVFPQTLSFPTLSVEQLCERLMNDIPNLAQELERNGVEIGERVISMILKELIQNDLLQKAASLSQTKMRLRTILLPVSDVIISKALKHEKPENFEDYLTSLLKMVR